MMLLLRMEFQLISKSIIATAFETILFVLVVFIAAILYVVMTAPLTCIRPVWVEL